MLCLVGIVFNYNLIWRTFEIYTKFVHGKGEQATLVACENDIIDTPQCDFSAYRKHICLEEGNPIIPTHYLSRCEAIIYNRVPKCASKTVGQIMLANSQRNRYGYIVGSAAAKYKYTMTPELRTEYSRMVHKKHGNLKFVLNEHFYFFNMSQTLRLPLLYVNVLREPVSWFQSAYSYFQSDSVHFRGKWWNKGPIDDCIKSTKCFTHIMNYFGAIHFLCGIQEACNDSRSGLQIAKRRVEEDYLVVGHTERLEDFLEVLEFLIPNMFRGLTYTFVVKQEKLHTKYQTRKKLSLTNTTTDILKQLLAPEIDLYLFVEQRFNNLHHAISKIKKKHT